MAAAANEIERGNAGAIEGNRLAINDAGARAQACQRLDDQREATGEVIARTPHLRAGLASNDAEAVMFDFMQPLAAGRQLVGFGWEARRDEPGRQGTLHRRCPTLFTSAAAGRALGLPAVLSSLSYTTTLRSLSALMILLFSGLSPERTMLINDGVTPFFFAHFFWLPARLTSKRSKRTTSF